MAMSANILSTQATTLDAERAANLLSAQNKALSLFNEIERTLLRPGISESVLSQEIHSLAHTRFGVQTHWHKRVIRSGPNTLFPYAENPPDRIIQADDILFVDLGPVFEAWEADFGRTFVLGNDSVKLRLRDDLEVVWEKVKARYNEEREKITGERLYEIAREEAKAKGWEFGGVIAGHLVGSFPHERIPRDKITLYITNGSNTLMSDLDKEGRKRHWILEIHLVDREKEIGGFFEQLLTVG